MIDEQSIARDIIENFPQVETADSFGYTFLFYRDDHRLPFVTIGTIDHESDSFSLLDRPGVFRVSIGVSKQTFQTLYGAGDIQIENYDFTALDTLLPHPVYWRQSFLCVLNPSDATYQRLRPLFAEAYELAAQRYNRRRPQT